MKRIFIIATVLLVLSLTATASPSMLRNVHASAYIEPALADALATSSASSPVQVGVVLDHIPTSSDSQAFQSFSTRSFTMSRLPMILSYTNYGRLTRIASYPGATPLWSNRHRTDSVSARPITHTSADGPSAH